MLPRRFDATGLYSIRVHQRTAAFRLLVHAEFESFIEDRVMTHVKARVLEWSESRRPSLTLAALFAYDGAQVKAPASILYPPQGPAGRFDERLSGVVSRYNRQVRVTNHGVREDNILGMLLPIGVDASDIDLAWLGDLDGWAKDRGTLAHQSLSKVGISIDPHREYAKVKQLLGGFKKVDVLISQLP